MENKIKKSYKNISPTDEQKDRILSNILNSNVTVNSNNTKVIRKEFFMKRKSIVAAIIIICILTVSVTTYAAFKWLNANQVTQKMGHDKLSEALAKKYGKSENQIQVMKGDKITAHYLGFVSGKKLIDDFEVNIEKSYIITAISKNDGSKLTYDENIIVTPFIKGINPKDFNIYTIDGEKHSQIIDGILYSITACDTLEIFADKGAYIGVLENPDFTAAYNFNKTTGEITQNNNFKGLNLLFEVKLDASKADPEAAKKFLRFDSDDINLYSESKENMVSEKNLKEKYYKQKFIDISDDSDIAFYYTQSDFIDGSKKKLKPNANGDIVYKYEHDWISFPQDCHDKQIFFYMNDSSDKNDTLISIEYTNGNHVVSLYKSSSSVRKKVFAKEKKEN